MFPAAADNAKEQSAFLRLSERLGEVISLIMRPRQKDLPFIFPITSGKARLLDEATIGSALDLQRPRGLAFRPSGGAPPSLS